MAISNKYSAARPSLYLNFYKSRQLDPRVSLSRASTGTYIDAEGILRTAGPNEPRFEYENGECKGLLIEESRTNVIKNSSNLNGSNWYDPYGTITVTNVDYYQKLEITTDVADLMIYRLDNTVVGNIAPNRLKVCYADMKAGSVKYGYLVRKASYQNYNDQCIIFDLESGAVVFDSFSTGSRGTIYLGNGFYRCWAVTQTIGSTSVQDHFGVGICNSKSDSRIKSVGDYIYVARTQYETAANTDYTFPTSYIPTTTTTVTRAADKVTVNDLSWFNDYEGTFVVDTSLPGVTTTTTLFSVDNGSSQIVHNNTVVRVGAGKSLYPIVDDKNILGYSSSKNLIVSSESNAAFFSTVTSLPIGMNRLAVGWNPFKTNDSLNGTLKSFRYYPSLLTDDEVKSLLKTEQSTKVLSTDLSLSSVGIATSGLVLHFDAGISTSYPGSGTRWYDLSGNYNTGILKNGVGYGSSGGGTLVFDGNNDYVDCGLSSFQPTGMTLCAWVTHPGVRDGGIIIKGDVNGSAEWGLSFGYNVNFGGDHYLVGRENVYFNQLLYSWGGTLFTGFHYVCYAMTNDTSAALYVDGVGVASTTVIGSIGLNSRNVLIGKWNDYAPISGNIAQVSIYNRALTATEIQQNFNALKDRFGL